MNSVNDLPINYEEEGILIKYFICFPGFPGSFACHSN